MSKRSQLDAAIRDTENEIAVLMLVLAKLKAQRDQAPKRKRKDKPLLAEVK